MCLSGSQRSGFCPPERGLFRKPGDGFWKKGLKPGSLAVIQCQALSRIGKGRAGVSLSIQAM